MKNILVTVFALMISGHVLAGGIEACPTNKVDKCSDVKTQDACKASYTLFRPPLPVFSAKQPFSCIWDRGHCTEKHRCDLDK